MATYQFLELALASDQRTKAQALNEKGQTAGHVNSLLDEQGWVAAFWNEVGSGSLLDWPGVQSSALGINDGGSVAGVFAPAPKLYTRSNYEGWPRHGFVDHNGSRPDMRSLLGTEYSNIRDINNAGKVVGEAGGGGLTVPFVYDVEAGSSPLFPLGKPPGDVGYQHAAAINNHGAVVGNSGTPWRGFLYTGGSPIDLGPGSGATAISDSGLIAGTITQGGSDVAAVYDTNGSQPKFEPIGHLPGHDTSNAFSINDKGEVVGSSWQSGDDRTRRGFLYKDQDGGMTDLNDLIPAGSGWVLSDGKAINNADEILAWGTRTIFVGDIGTITHSGSCLLIPSHRFRVPRETYRSLWEVLRGLLDDTPGVLWPSGGPPSGPPIPVHPNWRLDPNKQDVLSGLAVNQMASLVNDPDVRRHVEEAGIRVMEESVRKLREGL